jgi:hypothetical protein
MRPIRLTVVEALRADLPAQHCTAAPDDLDCPDCVELLPGPRPAKDQSGDR